MKKVEITTEQVKSLQRCELEMLRIFIDVCEKLGMKYYLLGGTLLGAVRHQGFIPWDDDIDVGMLRADYEKLVQYGQDYLPEGFFLQTHQTDPEYPANFAKLRNCNTTFVEYSVKNCNINHGVYIDIFPLDYYPDHGVILFDIKALLMKLRITDAFVPGKMKLKTKIVRCISRVLYPSISETIQKRDVLFKSVIAGRRVTNHCGAWGRKEIVPAEWFGEGQLLLFEGLKVRVPACYHEWLTQVYGNYMQLPPEEKRIGHHYVAAFDLEKPFTHYMQIRK